MTNAKPISNPSQIRSSDITPPPELVLQWYLSAKAVPVDQWATDVATAAAQWGADQELEACCEWVAEESPFVATELHAARRPKPPSLAEEALAELAEWERTLDIAPDAALRRALERLKELESNG